MADTIHQWRLRPHQGPEAVPGAFLFDVPPGHRGASGLKVSYAERRTSRGQRFIGLRVTLRGVPLMWIDIDDWWESIAVLWATPPVEGWPRSVLPAIAWPEVDGADIERWMLRTLNRLMGCDESPFYSGRWWCGPLSTKKVRAHLAGGDQPVAEIQWFEQRLLPTRLLSAPDVGRVKAWRKRAQAGDLPPVVALYCSVAEVWLVLDGHDRLAAALAEGVEPVLIGISPVRTRCFTEEPDVQAAMEHALAEQIESIDWAKAPRGRLNQLNERLQRLYAGEHLLEHISRVWPLTGGVERWHAEVRAQARSLEGSAREVVERMLWAESA